MTICRLKKSLAFNENCFTGLSNNYTNTSIVENRAQFSNAKYWTYDTISGPESKNIHVYESLINRNRIQKAVDGYNISILAYGQTSSGKTHTISGTLSEPGLLRLTIKQLFETIESAAERRKFIIRISVLEVYNEIIYDLLHSSLSSRTNASQQETNYPKKGGNSNTCIRRII